MKTIYVPGTSLNKFQFVIRCSELDFTFQDPTTPKPGHERWKNSKHGFSKLKSKQKKRKKNLNYTLGTHVNDTKDVM